MLALKPKKSKPLPTKLQRLKQQINRLKSNLNRKKHKMKIQQQSERKARTRLLIQAGGLLHKSGILEVFHIRSSDNLQAYENRIIELEHQVRAKDEQNRELVQLTIAAAREKLELERVAAGMEWN